MRNVPYMFESPQADDPFAPVPSDTPVSMGTTVMAAEFDGGVVIGADTRTTTGQFVCNRVSRKIDQLHKRIFVARSGSAADTIMLSKYTRRFLDAHALEIGELPRVNSAASLLQLMCYENKDQLLAGLIVGGWDKRKGGQVYQIPLGGSKIRMKVALGGSGSSYITGLVASNYRAGMSRNECVEFVKNSIAYAMRSDGSSGGMIRLFVITEQSVEEQLVRGNELPVS